jgi:cytochrome c
VIRSAALRRAILLLIGVSPAHAEAGDPNRGERVFQYCFACHAVREGEANLQGPNLRGIVGGRIAAQAGFDYSPAMRAFAQREASWSETLLDRYLAAPYAVVPNTSMSFPGLSEAEERADVIAYLRSHGQHD